MKKIPTDTCVNINPFPLYFLDIDRKVIQSMVSIFQTHPFTSYLFMTEDATYAYGEEICKWLSLKHNSKRPQKIDILNDKKIIQVESGHEFVAVLTDDGLVYLASGHPTWKTNNTFRLIPTGNDRFEMMACEGNKLLLLRQDGTVFAFEQKYWGHDDSELVTLVNIDIKNVKIIACGADHSLALTNTNEIYSWGWNNHGQLGIQSNNPNIPTLVSFADCSINSPIKNIVAGARHSLFILEDGQVFGCGYGQRSINDDKEDAKVPTKIPIENVQSVACTNNLDLSLALDQSSHYYVWGMARNLEFLPPIKLDNLPRSFSSASLAISSSAITFGLTPFVFEYDDPILKLFNNPDNYDVEFIVDNRSILACKCHLKKESEYYSRMFSGDWKDANKVIIRNYSYNIYRSYLRMLHEEFYGFNIYQSNIAELIDLANCYNDERLMKHCREFIQKELNVRTIFTYLPLIDKYEIDEMHDKLVKLTMEDILPKITKNIQTNKKNITKFLLWFSEQKSFLKKEFKIEFD